MKKSTLFSLLLIFSISLLGQSEDTTIVVNDNNTRNYTLVEAFSPDTSNTLKEYPLIKSFESVGLQPVREAYKLNRLMVDSILVADSLNANFWRVYGYQAAFIFVQANKSPSAAMAIFLPFFVILSLIIITILTIKTFFIRPYLSDAEKPNNDPNASLDDSSEEEFDDEQISEEDSLQNEEYQDDEN